MQTERLKNGQDRSALGSHTPVWKRRRQIASVIRLLLLKTQRSVKSQRRQKANMHSETSGPRMVHSAEKSSPIPDLSLLLSASSSKRPTLKRCGRSNFHLKSIFPVLVSYF